MARFHVTIAERGALWRSCASLKEYTDISVDCGTSSIGLAIQICPVVYTGYNESQLILNNVVDNSDCKGTLDESVSPPVLRFTFPINATNACSSSFKVSSKNPPMIRFPLVNLSLCSQTDDGVAFRPPVHPAQGSLPTSPTSRRWTSAVWCAPMILRPE